MNAITKEEREEWKEIAANAQPVTPTGIVDFKDGENLWHFTQQTVSAWEFDFLKTFQPAIILRLLGALEAAEDRADEMESQRNWLAAQLSARDADNGGKHYSVEQWLEWAEGAKEEGE